MRIVLYLCLNVLTVSLVAASMDGVTVTASTYEEAAAWCKDGTCAPAHTVDGDIADASSWRADGVGAWIQYDLGTVRSIDSVNMVFMKGDTRQYYLGIQVSVDGSAWQTLVERDTTAGVAGWEYFDVDDCNARFVRIIGYGNSNTSFGTWINVNEVDIIHSDASSGMREHGVECIRMAHGALFLLDGSRLAAGSASSGACVFRDGGGTVLQGLWLNGEVVGKKFIR